MMRSTQYEEFRTRIEEIIGTMECPKDFACYTSGFEDLPRTRDFGLDDCLECLESDRQPCRFSLAFGYGHFCRCPLRLFVAKTLHK